MPNRLKVPFDKNNKEVTVRFAPEPSGYLHIGHTKPLYLNDTIRQDFNGKFIVRFDDTNPKKESDDFESSIRDDINTLGISIDQITHTSDYFDIILCKAQQMLCEGNAYMDCTPADDMKDQRFKKEQSKYRNTSTDTNLMIFEKFVNDNTSIWCVRAKISYDNVNACLRDPVIMRACAEPHIKFGNKYNVYPTYDFCCPIVDYLEKVTHALRANEYIDHYDIYKWMCKKMGLIQPHVIHFAKIRFEYTVMSKRYLKEMVELNLVDGWDDPRLPTVRGLMNRGLTCTSLREYIISMGLNNKVSLPSWDKLWASNKKIIDKIIPRYSSVDFNFRTTLHINGMSPELVQYVCEKHPTNKSLGDKTSYLFNQVIVNKYDSDLFKIGDRVGLLRNMVVEVIEITDKLNIMCNIPNDQNFKNTAHKINWIANVPTAFTKHALIHYENLINKSSMDKGDKIIDIFNNTSKYCSDVLIEISVSDIKKGDFIQLERRGYYIFNGNSFVQIPEGRQKPMIN